MATAEGSYEGGAGGKFRKRPLRRAPTPYDRPPSVIRNPTIEVGRNGWLSKLMDPASRIITRSAHRLFSSVFRKNLPAPPTVPEANHESRNEFSEVVSFQNPSSGAQEQVCNEGDKPSNHADINGINELEQILKQKTFTRSEIDHLTELLRSRTVNASAENENKRSEPSTLHLAAVRDRGELANIPLQENGMKIQSLLGGISAPVVLEENVASPAEVAKTYMGSRSSKVTPSTIGLCGQTFREDASLLTNVPLALKSPNTSLAPRSAVRFSGVPGVSKNGFMTPGSRGRSAIYSMARSPYSRVNHTATLQGAGSSIGAKAAPLALTPSQWPWENNPLSGGKQVSKRRSSVLDSDIGSVGPIRRIRQKTNLMSPSKNMNLPNLGSPLSTPVTVAASDDAQGSMSLIQKPLLLNGPKHNALVQRLVESEDNNFSSTDFSSVPSQSSEMAQKILQQLDKLVPSPKEKSSDHKLATAREKSPTKLTLSMLYGRALRSVEDVDSSKFLHNIEGTGTLDGHGVSNVPVARASTSQEQVRIEENGPTKILVLGDKMPLEENVVTTLSTKDTVPSVKTPDSVISNFAAKPSQLKRAFQISVHEDYLEFDDDSFSNRIDSIPTAAEKEKLDSSVVESKANATETVTVEKPYISSSERPGASFLGKKTNDIEASCTLVREKDVGFTFPVATASNTTTQPDMPTLKSPLLFNMPASSKEPTAAPVFSFSSKSVDDATPFTFSFSSSGVGESSGLKFSAQSDSKLQTFNSSSTVPATTTETTPSTEESDKGIEDNIRKAGDLVSQPENAISPAILASSAPNIFSFGASASNSSLYNGSVSSTPTLFSIPAATPASTGSTSNVFSGIATPVTAADTETRSSPSISAATSTFSTAPIFQFGSNVSAAAAASSSSASLPATSVVDSKDSEPKTKHASPFGSLSSSPFGAMSSSAFTSTGSSTFTFGASAPSATANPSSSANNQFQSSNTSATAGSMFGALTSPGMGVTPFTQTMPMQFGSSSSIPTFGFSGSSTSSSGSSLFGSSSPSVNPFASSSGFGASSSTILSTGAGSFSSGSATTGLFGSSTQSATPSVFGSGFGSTSSAPGFSFGLSSAVASTTSTAPMTFGSSIGTSSGSNLSFTSTAATISSASLSPSFPVFGSANPVTAFGSASPGNEQMNMEDSMAEDTVQASTPSVPGFGQAANIPLPSNYAFSSPVPSVGLTSFQFGSQQNAVAPQNPSSFQASGNLGFTAGGSFSLGSGGGDKSKRKIVKVRRDKPRNR